MPEETTDTSSHRHNSSIEGRDAASGLDYTDGVGGGELYVQPRCCRVVPSIETPPRKANILEMDERE